MTSPSKAQQGAERRASRTDEICSGPVGKVLFKVTVPMLIAIVAIMSLGVVDSYFLGKLGVGELAAIGFIMPVGFFVTSIALGIGMAISSLTSKLVGAKRMGRASRLVSDAMLFTLIMSLLIWLMMEIFHNDIFRLMGADADILLLIGDYMRYWMYAIPFTMLSLAVSSTFRALGDTATSAKITLSIAIGNIILDPLFIFGFGPIPAMGIAGAAFATLMSVLLPTVWALYLLASREQLLEIRIPLVSELIDHLKQLSDIAIPAILANIIQPLSGVYVTLLVASYGTAAVAGFGVGVRIEALSLIVIYAMSSTVPMFIGQNLGADKPQRVNEVLRKSLSFALFWQFAVYFLMAVSAWLVSGLFTQEAEAREIIHLYIYVILAGVPLNAVVIIINVSLNVLGRPRLAMYINAIKLFVFFIPFAYLGSQLGGIGGIFVGVILGYAGIFLLALYWLNLALRENNVEEVFNPLKKA